MHKKLILGAVLVLTLTLASPITAAEERPFTWPSFDVVEWVFGLLEILGSEVTGTGDDPSNNLDQENSPPTSEIGPIADPWG